MFFVEYIENNERKALNLAMCRKIETEVRHTSGKGSYMLSIHHEQYGKKVIQFESEEELLSTFDTLMTSLNEYQAHWMSPHPLRQEANRS